MLLCSFVQAVGVPCCPLPTRVHVTSSQSPVIRIAFEVVDRKSGDFYDIRDCFFYALHDDLLQSQFVPVLRCMGLDRHIPEFMFCMKDKSNCLISLQKVCCICSLQGEPNVLMILISSRS